MKDGVGDTPAQDQDNLLALARAIAGKELELEAKGFPRGTIKASIERGWGFAEHWAGKLPPDMRERGFQSFLTAELEGAEEWCAGVKAFTDSASPTEGAAE